MLSLVHFVGEPIIDKYALYTLFEDYNCTFLTNPHEGSLNKMEFLHLIPLAVEGVGTRQLVQCLALKAVSPTYKTGRISL